MKPVPDLATPEMDGEPVKVLVIDNYDSFTYNLVQYLGELGAELSVHRNDQISISDIERIAPERVVISPGPGRPVNAGVSLELVRRFADQLPILGVCLGHQVIGEAFGGEVVHAPELRHGKTSLVYHSERSIFEGIESPFEATRYHSLIVSRSTLPDCLEMTAWTDEGLIMGLRHREYNVQGVQFHPESLLTRCGMKILERFLCSQD